MALSSKESRMYKQYYFATTENNFMYVSKLFFSGSTINNCLDISLKLVNIDVDFTVPSDLVT